MKKELNILYKELQQRLNLLESENKDGINDLRIEEIELVILRVLQLLMP